MGGSFGQASGDETAALARQLRVGPEAQAFSEGLVVHPSGLLTDLGTEPILRAFPAALEPERFITGLRLIKRDRKSTRLNSSHGYISYAVFCLKKKKYISRKCSKTQ